MQSAVVHSHASPDEDPELTYDSAGEMTEDVDLNYVWKRPAPKDISPNPPMVAQFEVISAKILPTSDNANAKKYVLYKIMVRMQGVERSMDSLAYIERRYTELLSLYENLQKEYSTVLQEIVFPKKRLLGNFSEDVIGGRAIGFEDFLDFIITVPALRETPAFMQFIQDIELQRACICIDERRHEQAIPVLENCYRVLNKIYLDKSRAVLLILCRLVAACTGTPIIHPNTDHWVNLTLRRFEHVSDVEILVLYVPLLQTCVKYFKQRGEDDDSKVLEDRLVAMGKKGIKVKGNLSLQQTLHVMEPRSETA